MKKIVTFILLTLLFSSFEIKNCKDYRTNYTLDNESIVFDKQFKTIILGQDNAEKTEFVSALTFYLSNNSIGSYLSKEKVEKLKINYKINNENIEISEVILKTPHNDHKIFVNDDPEMTSKFLTSKIVNFDAAILLVTHTDGTMPYTLKHLQKFKQMGIKNLFCFVTKSEMVEDEYLSNYVKKEIVSLLDSTHIDASNTVIVFGSTKVNLLKNNSNWMSKIKSVVDFMDQLK